MMTVVPFLVSFVRLIFTVFKALFNFAYRLISSILLLVGIGLIFLTIAVAGNLWVKYYPVVIPYVEEKFRCDIVPFYNSTVRPFLTDFLLELYDKGVIYWNGYGEIQRAFANKMFTSPLVGCVRDDFNNTETIVITARKSYVEIVNFGKQSFLWMFFGITDNIFPTYTIADGAARVLISVMNVGKCACAIASPVWLTVEKMLGSNKLKCTIHQYAAFIQRLFQNIYHTILNTIASIRNYIDTPAGNTPLDTQFSYQLAKSAEVLNSGTYYLFGAVDEALENILCAGASFQNFSVFDMTPYDTVFNNCKATSEMRIRVFSTIPPLYMTFIKLFTMTVPNIDNLGLVAPQSIRTGEVLFDLLWNNTNIIIEGDLNILREYANNTWRLDMLFDTLRVPRNRTSALDTSDFLTTFFIPNASLPSCKTTYSSFYQSCQECSDPPTITFEQALCILGSDFDVFMNSKFDNYPVGLGEQIFCCILGRATRIVVSVIQLGFDMLRSLFKDGLEGFFTNYATSQAPIDMVFDEVIGARGIKIEQDINGGTGNTSLGILQCIPGIINIIDVRARCIGDLIILLIKPALELLRLGFYLVSGLIGQIVFWAFGTPSSPNRVILFDMICIDGPYCFDIEASVFQYIRKGRFINSTSDVNIYLNYTMIDQTNANGFLECFCLLINSDFINSFLEPSQQQIYPDICCGFYFLARIFIDIGKFILLAGFALSQTIIDLLNATFFSTPITDIVLLSYLSCLDDVNATDGSVSKCVIPDIISDAKDIFQCPCLILIYIEDSLGAVTYLTCLCDLTTSLTNAIVYAYTAVANLAQTIIQMLDCTATGRLDSILFPECGTILQSKFIYGFDLVELSLQELGNGAGALGCLLGAVFPFDCVDGSTDGLIISCLNPSCTPADSLRLVFKKATEFFYTFFLVPIEMLKGIFLAIFGQFNSVTNTFTDFLLVLLQNVGEPLFGNPSLPITDPDFRGLIQYVGVFLNCILGPTNNCNALGTCFGQIFILAGDGIRSVYNDIVTIFTNLINLVISLLTGSSAGMITALENIFAAISNLLETFLSTSQQVLNFFKDLLLAIVREFLPFGDALASVLNVILTVLVTFLGGIIDALLAVLRFFGLISKKRDDGSNKYDISTIITNINNDENSLLYVELIEAQDGDSICGRLFTDVGLVNEYGKVPRNSDNITSREMAIWEEFGLSTCLTAKIGFYNWKNSMIVNNLLKRTEVMKNNGPTTPTGFQKRTKLAWQQANEEPLSSMANDTFTSPYKTVKLIYDLFNSVKKYKEWMYTSGYMLAGVDHESLLTAADDYWYDRDAVTGMIGAQYDEYHDNSTYFVKYTDLIGSSDGEKLATEVLQYYEKVGYYKNSLDFIKLAFRGVKIIDDDEKMIAMNNNVTTTTKRSTSVFGSHDRGYKIHKKSKVTIGLLSDVSDRLKLIYTTLSKVFWDKLSNVTVKESARPGIEFMRPFLPFSFAPAPVKQANMKRGTQQCETCDCVIYDNIEGSINDSIQYVIARQSIVPQYFTGGPLYKITPYTGASFTGLFRDLFASFTFSNLISVILSPVTFTDNVILFIQSMVNSLVGFDIFQTALDFFSNTGLEEPPPGEYVGFLFALKYIFYIILFSECNRDINLRCKYGFGIKQSFKYNTIVFWLVFPAIFAFGYLLGPPVMFSFNLLLMTGVPYTMLYMYSVAVFAWHYSIRCAFPAQSFLLMLVAPMLPLTPLVPECAGEDTNNMLNDLFSNYTIADFFPPASYAKNTSAHPECPDLLQFENCTRLLNVSSNNDFFGLVLNDVPFLKNLLNLLSPGIVGDINKVYNTNTTGLTDFDKEQIALCYDYFYIGLAQPILSLVFAFLTIGAILIFLLDIIGSVLTFLTTFPPFVLLYMEIIKPLKVVLIDPNQ